MPKQILSKTRSNWWQQVADLFDVTYNKANSSLLQLYSEAQKGSFHDLLEMYYKIYRPGYKATANDLFKYQRYYELFNNLNDKMVSLGGKEVEITEKAMKELYINNKELVGKSLNYFLDDLNDAEVVKAVNTIWCQDGRLYSDRIWQDKAMLVDQLKQTMLDAVVRGKSPDYLEKQMINRLNVGYNQTERIIVTELAHVQNKAAIDTYVKAGVNKYRILHEPDACEECKNLGKLEFPVTQTPVIPSHPFCRCVTLAIL